MITSSIDDQAPARRRRLGVKVRRSVSGLAVAALLVAACGSADDTVSTDGDVEEPADGDQSVESAAAPESDDTENDDNESDDTGGAALQHNGPIDVTGAALPVYDSALDDLTIGSPAPVIAGESFDGTPITIGAPTDNPTFVVFLAHWCPHCNEEVPELIGLEEAGRLPDGLDVIGVSTAADPTRDNFPPSEWIDDRGWPWPTMVDDESLTAIASMGGATFPFAVVLDTDGNVLARRAGQATADETVEFLDAALADA